VGKIVTWVIVGLAIVLAEISLLGILLVWKKNKCISVLHVIQLIILLIIFGIIAIGIGAGLKRFDDEITCQKLDFLEDADKAYKKGDGLLCSGNCVCKAT